MSYVDGQVGGFRGGRTGGPVERGRITSGAIGQTVRYSFATGVTTANTPLVLTLVGASPDPIGSVTGTNTWTPNDARSRYLIHVHVQTFTGNAAICLAQIATNSGTVPVCAGANGTTGVLHLTLTADAVDFSTALNLQVIPGTAMTLGDVTGAGQANVNFISITRLAVV